MIEVLNALWPFVFGVAFNIFLRYWSVTACRCKRQRLPWFTWRHEKEWVILAYATFSVTVAILIAITGGPIGLAILAGLVFLFQIKIYIEHHKGKRSVLGRIIGRVVVNRHGRLEVQQ